jgi:hypothetical protein
VEKEIVMVYIKSLMILAVAIYGFVSWMDWVGKNDEHLFKVMDCLSEHRDISRQEAVYLCELEAR